MIRFVLRLAPDGHLPDDVPPTTALAASVDTADGNPPPYAILAGAYPDHDVIGFTRYGYVAQVFDLDNAVPDALAAAQWSTRMRDIGLTPWVFCRTRTYASVRYQCAVRRLTPPLWWNSVIAPGAFMPDGASATRYAQNFRYDSHVVDDGDDTPKLYTNPSIMAGWQ